MSQDYIFNFQHGFERSSGQDPIRRELQEVDDGGGLPTVYESGAAGMLSEMFNFPASIGSNNSASELLMNQINYQQQQQQQQHQQQQQQQLQQRGNINNQQRSTTVGDWYGNSSNNHAAMQLFITNPSHESSSNSPSATSSTLHMLLPNSTLQHQGHFGQFTWGGGHGGGGASHEGETTNVGGVEGLSLSLSSSLQHLEAATKVEDMRIGDHDSSSASGMLYFNDSYNRNLQMGQTHHPVHIGFGSSTLGAVKVLRNSIYVKPAQELLEEFCSVGRGHLKKHKSGSIHNNPNINPTNSGGGGGGGDGGGGGVSLTSAERIEHQRRKVKLSSMLDEVDRRYNHYCEQMQMVVNSFDLVMGFGAAVPYTALAQKAMSRHFRCLKDAITASLKHSCEILGEKDAGSLGVTKGETPRLKLLELSLRQQRAFNQMGMMEQEAWRPQRGLPERSVNILRAWLFEHFLHPYPSDADKHLLARQTGLSRNQVSNWFINARVRLWKPMVEEMYQQEGKEEEEEEDGDHNQIHDNNQTGSENNNIINDKLQTPNNNINYKNGPFSSSSSATLAQTPMHPPPPPSYTKRSEFNDPENDPSILAINTQTSSSEIHATAMSPSFPDTVDDTSDDIGSSTLIRFGTTSGDVSLTLGLRHAGNLPETSFSFGGC
ncbi:BEL1-like homeodomain protein 2 [Rutidosis leptorrhynchoides]|uniref:BEL1-like homeodomain protein 2 n=1 Tax=Rutidosis leptorrhynchoides TaxID=125765 RepID=UPI003A99E41F